MKQSKCCHATYLKDENITHTNGEPFYMCNKCHKPCGLEDMQAACTCDFKNTGVCTSCVTNPVHAEGWDRLASDIHSLHEDNGHKVSLCEIRSGIDILIRAERELWKRGALKEISEIPTDLNRLDLLT